MKKLTLTAIVMSAMSVISSCNCEEKKCDATADEKNATEAVIENIMTRTSIRQFTDQPISQDTLETIVKAGMAAPSAVNAQPWAFVVVTEREILDSLRAIHPYSNLKTATAAIIVCGDMEKNAKGTNSEYWVQDCSAATENILLAAHAFGIGAVWCGVYPNPERIPGVKEVLGLPDYIMPLNIITMGYPAENPEPKDKWNADNVHYQKW